MEDKYLDEQDFIVVDKPIYYEQAKKIIGAGGNCNSVKELDCNECFLCSLNTRYEKDKKIKCYGDKSKLINAETFLKAYEKIQEDKKGESDNMKIQEDGFIEISDKAVLINQIIEELSFLQGKRKRLIEMLESTISFLKFVNDENNLISENYGYIALSHKTETFYMDITKIKNSQERSKKVLIEDIECVDELINDCFIKYIKNCTNLTIEKEVKSFFKDDVM